MTSKIFPNRLRSAAIVLAAAFLSSCTLLPPSLQKKEASAVSAAQSPVAGGRSGPPASDPRIIDVPAPQGAVEEAKLYKGTGQFVNPRPARPPGPLGPQEASLNFEGLDVREVAKVILGDYLKETYTVHPSVQGTVTFRTIRPISLKDLLPTLEMLLRQNGAAVVREDGVYKILPVPAVRGSVSPQLGGSNRPLPAGFSVIVVPLKFVGAREMQRLLEPFAADNTVRIDETRNLVVMAGSQRELQHLVDTVELFDVDWLSGYSIGLFPIKSADVKTLVQDLERIFGPSAQGPLAGIVRIIPIERLNAILMVTTQPKYLDMAKTWADRLDQAGGTGGGTRFFVYRVRNGKAENLAQLVSDLFSSRRTTTSAPTLAPGSRPTEIRSTPFGQPQSSPQTTTTSVTPPASATFTMPGATGSTGNEVRVIADKDTNSLLIMATPADYDVIENAIRQLDVVPRQVLVEVMLAEVILDDQFDAGIGWFFNAQARTSGRLAGPGVPTTPTGTPGLPDDRANWLQIIHRSTSGDIRAVLNLLGSDGKAQVLASPQIMVLDNQKAQIKVGDRISVQTQTQTGVSTGTGLLNSFQYLETGILLAVTPRINSGGLVTLEVNQEVSVPGTPQAGNPNPPVNSRSAETTVVVASGESIVMGGLIREDNSRGSAGIPLLSKIPILGAAFGNQFYSRRRTELVLIITPRIVSDTVQAREVTEEFRRKLPSLEGLLPKPKDPPPPAPALPTPPPPSTR